METKSGCGEADSRDKRRMEPKAVEVMLDNN